MFAAAAASRASKGGPETAGRSIGIGSNLGAKKSLVGAADADDILDSIMADLEKDDSRDRRRRRGDAPLPLSAASALECGAIQL